MTRRVRHFGAGAVLVLLSITGSACGDDGGGGSGAAEQSSEAGGSVSRDDAQPSVDVNGDLTIADQTSDGKVVRASKVSLVGGNAWLAIHADQNGQPGEIVGKVLVPEGINPGVTVTLDTPATTGTYWAMLHVDAGNFAEFEPTGADKEIEGTSKRFQLTVGTAG